MISRLKPHPTPLAVHDSVVTDAIRLIEETGPLDDASAMREAAGATHSSDRIARRAAVLGRRIGLETDIDRARHLAPWIGLGLTLLVVLAGLSLAASVTGSVDRRINILAALFSLLGFHILTMMVWLAGLLLPSRLRSLPHASLGWLWLTLTARVAGGRNGQMPVLLRSATRLLMRARLLPWAMGTASHAIWTLSFAVVLAAVLFALAFHRYTLGWETTILDADFFVRAVQWLGWLPERLGFPVPDPASILASGGAALDAPDVQRALAWWLAGCIAIYGFLPRLLALAVCLAVWKARSGGLQPDLSLPYFHRLIARFDAIALKDIVDADRSVVGSSIGSGKTVNDMAVPFSDALVIAGYELPTGHPWPPVELSVPRDPSRPAPTWLDIDGSAQSRRRLLDVASRVRPRRLLLACRAASSPDRGTERLLRELLAHCGDCGLWLVGDAGAPTDREGRVRWRRWLADAGLPSVAAYDDLVAASEGSAT
ncbi:MAG: DUF2868 domain-containing protein [Janthinobacterium lividum]